MKKLITLCVLTLILLQGFTQNYYWVFYKDKSNSSFDPYSYFDAKAIERRQRNNISLYDISDYPLCENYVLEIKQFCDDYTGESRWLNASAIYTDAERAAYIAGFDFVLSVQLIQSDAQLSSDDTFQSLDYDNDDEEMIPQLHRMEGEQFMLNKIDGTGIRIAVFDGGFPGVDTHEAFKHLRDNNRIIKTWNFPKKYENVYGWNSHGTSVLSCIAGIDANGNNIGLATGSEFLLARTEVNAEPAKEEVYWAMALEWADKNGADIVNSSLGYGAERHRTKDMDGKTCVVSKAADMAASKGILVVNAAGNEGDDKSWRTIGAPADAENILSVGGIEDSGDFHISFSSFGPTADGRLKPNVSAFGYAKVAEPEGYGYAYGTSFASPLVAGFAACAWQIKRDFTAIQMKAEIEKSADRYPFFDYANGYGVPMASYFFSGVQNAEKYFEILDKEDYVLIQLTENVSEDLGDVLVFYHIRNSDGKLFYYEQSSINAATKGSIEIPKSMLVDNRVLMVNCNYQTEEFKLKEADFAKYKHGEYDDPEQNCGAYAEVSDFPGTEKLSKYGPNAGYYFQPFIAKSFVAEGSPNNYNLNYFGSGSFAIGFRYKQNVTKWFALGLNLDYTKTKTGLKNFSDFVNDNQSILKKHKESFVIKNFNLEFYERIRLVPAGMTGLGLFWDCGVYGSYITKSTFDLYYKTETVIAESSEKLSLNDNLQYGVISRFGYGLVSIYGKYRLSDLILDNQYLIPRLEVGLEFTIPTAM